MTMQRIIPSTRRLLMVMALALLASVLPLTSAVGQAPTARSLLNVPFKGVATPGPTFDLVQSVVDFGPGATSHVITTGTAHYLSVLDGDLTVSVDGKAEVVGAGKGMSVPAGAKLILSNAGTAQTARLFAATLLSVGAVTDVHFLSAPGIKVFATARRTMFNAPAVVDITQMAAVYDAGYRTANHVMNEFHLMIHLAGQTGYAYLDGGVESYAAGTQGVMYEARAGWMRNDGQSTSSMAWTWVGPPGKPLTTAVVAPAPPNTGTGQAKDAPTYAAATGLILTVLGLSAFAATRTRRAHLTD